MKLDRLFNWSLRSKLAVLIVAGSVVPLVVMAWLDISQLRSQLVAGIEQRLVARAEQIRRDIDELHNAYLTQGDRVSRLPDLVSYCAASQATQGELAGRVAATMNIGVRSDKYIASLSIIDPGGRVMLATHPAMVGRPAVSSSSLDSALAGKRTISQVRVGGDEAVPGAWISYLYPVPDASGTVRCVFEFRVHAERFWKSLPVAPARADASSFAVVVDSLGIRIAHSADPALVYRPTGPLTAAQLQEQVRTQRFGPATRQLLETPRSVSDFHGRATAASAPDAEGFQAHALSNGKVNFAVARRVHHTPWTVFVLQPEESVAQALDGPTREKVALSAFFILVAAVGGILLAANIVGRVDALRDATARLAAGDNDARIANTGPDEFGMVGQTFNLMADRIQSQASALKMANTELEARVRERTGLLNAVVDNSPASIVLKDLQGRYLLVNEGAARTTRATREQLIGSTAFDVFPQATAERVAAVDASVVAADAPVSEEFLSALPDGIHSYFSVRFPVRQEDGTVYAIGNIALDITERKKAEEKLIAQLDRMQLLDRITTAIGERLDLPSIQGVVIQSLEEQLLVDFCCILDYRADEQVFTVASVGGNHLQLGRELMAPEHRRIPLDGNGLARCVAGELVYEPDISGTSFDFPARLARAGLASLVLAPLTAEGRVLGVLVVARRLSKAFSSTDCEFLRQLGGHVALAGQQAQLADALRQTNQELRESQQKVLQQERLGALGQMASGIAHDINNAISPVALYTEALLEREPGLSAKARAYLEIIARSIDDVAATVARMREFSRPRAVEEALLPVNLNEMAQQVAQLTHAKWHDMPHLGGISIEMVMELEPDLPAVMGTEGEIREALTNLVFNAVDAMPAGGRLTIRTSCDADAAFVCLDVEDTGTGMDEDTRRRCLEPFYTTKGERGTGLGLAMVYGTAQRHRALVDIDSTPGQGTRVRLSFPATADSANPRPAAPQAAHTARLHLLIVDDDPLLRKSLRDALEADGHQVDSASGGQEAIAAFTAAAGTPEAFDMVITDLGMAHVDGRQVAAAVKALSANTPVVMLTGWGRRMLDEDDVPADVDRVLSKPPRIRDLRDAIEQLMKGPRA
ncbi:MAG: PAS domain-containing protein [Pseudomonadota bacterium]